MLNKVTIEEANLLPSVPAGQQGALVDASRHFKIVVSDFMRDIENPTENDVY